MKRISLLLFSLVIVAATLCAAKSANPQSVKPVAVWPSYGNMHQVECLLMDTSAALIPDATITMSSGEVGTTSWDGRFVLSAEQLTAAGKITITHSDYQPVKIKLTANDLGKTLVYCLKHKKQRQKPEYAFRLGSYSLDKSTAVSSDMMLMSAAVEYEIHYADMEEPINYEVMEGSFAAVNAPSAGKLTAGEVNDFAKWHLWDKVLNGSHSQYVPAWGIRAAERYVLQMTNQTGYPVVNAEVSLQDEQGNLVFRTRTDNTGRAELWNGLVAPACQGPLMLVAGEQRIEARPFAKGINTIQVDQPCQAPASADVFFIFDATGSMGDELSYLQAEMKDVIARSQSAVEGLSIRTGALVYRDRYDEYVTRLSRLSQDIQTTQTFIDRQSADGGGDYEEAIPEALMASINAAGWDSQARARIAFLILDAPCHQDSATIALLHEQVLSAAQRGIRLVPVVCSGLDEKGELLMRSLALSTNGTSFFLTDDSGIGGTHLRPTTDQLEVEHLNDMMVRTIISYTRMPECVADVEQVDTTAQDSLLAMDKVEQFLPNPFETEDLDSVPAPMPEEPVSAIMLVRPNPCSDYCLVDLPKGADALFLSDVSGKSIMNLGRFDAYTMGMSIDVSSLSTGVYFLKAFVGGRWYTQKLIVR